MIGRKLLTTSLTWVVSVEVLDRGENGYLQNSVRRLLVFVQYDHCFIKTQTFEAPTSQNIKEPSFRESRINLEASACKLSQLFKLQAMDCWRYRKPKFYSSPKSMQ